MIRCSYCVFFIFLLLYFHQLVPSPTFHNLVFTEFPINFHLRELLTYCYQRTLQNRKSCLLLTLYQVPWVNIVFLCIYFVYWKLPSHFMVDKLSQFGKILSEGAFWFLYNLCFTRYLTKKRLHNKSIEIEENTLNAP